MMQTTVLIIEEEKRLRVRLRDALQAHGYKVITTDDGKEALTLIAERRPDMILLSVQLSDMSGLEVCSQVRTFSAVPIVLMSAPGQDQDTVRGFEMGADEYMTKPLSVEEVLARIRAILRRTALAVCRGERFSPKFHPPEGRFRSKCKRWFSLLGSKWLS